jgi:hypothetical protein
MSRNGPPEDETTARSVARSSSFTNAILRPSGDQVGDTAPMSPEGSAQPPFVTYLDPVPSLLMTYTDEVPPRRPQDRLAYSVKTYAISAPDGDHSGSSASAG